MYISQQSYFSDQLSALYKSCYLLVPQLQCVRPYLDLKTTSTIATSIVHSKSLQLT